MLTGASTTALIVKMFPYIIAIKVVGGLVDIGVHTIKCKIGGVPNGKKNRDTMS